MNTIALKCQCGAVTGKAHNISANKGNRIVCYCDDCQAFAHHLGAAETALDAHGGSDIFQTPPTNIKIETGAELIKSLRLTPKGLTRWYSECCQTPIANTMSAKMPFSGLISTFMEDDFAASTGPVRIHVMGQFAKKGLPTEKYNEGFPRNITLRIMRQLIGWKLTGKNKPNPFYKNGLPISKPKILDNIL